MATLVDRCGEHPAAIEPIADRIVATIDIIACREQQRLRGVSGECPAADRGRGNQCTAQTEKGTALHNQSPSWALKPICTPKARASSFWCRRCRTSISW